MLSLGRSLAPVPRRLAARRAPRPVARRWNQQASAGSHALDPLDATRRKLLYRSKQRGWLEMDIMLGNWAAANLPRLQEAASCSVPCHGNSILRLPVPGSR